MTSPRTERRKLSFQNFEEVRSDVELLQHGYHQTGNWNLSQICDHLRIVMNSSMNEMDIGIPKFVRWFIKQLVLKKILQSKKMATGIKLKKDWNLTPPKLEKDDPKFVHDFLACLAAFQHHPEEYCPHVAFGTLSRTEWQQLQLIHCSHHLSFLVPTSK